MTAFEANKILQKQGISERLLVFWNSQLLHTPRTLLTGICSLVMMGNLNAQIRA